MNVVYVGIPNPLTIVVEKTDGKNVLVTTDNGKIASYDNGHYIYEPNKPGKAVISVNVKVKNAMKKLQEFEYRVKSLPIPTARLAGKNGGYITRALLCAQIAPSAYLDGFDFDAKFVITKFKVIITRDKQVIYETTLADEHGTRFDEKTKKVFCSLNKDDAVWITDIECKDPGNKVRNIDDLNFVIE